MGAEQPVMSLPRYKFVHGADFEVKYLGRRDVPGHVIKDLFAVTGGGAKVYFEMMRRPGQEWGFGDIQDPVTGRTLWDFRTFMQSPKAAELKIHGMKGDMTPVRGEGNRTYVDFRTKRGQPIKQFLLADLLPRWNAVAKLPVPPLPVPVEEVPENAAVTPPPVQVISAVVEVVPTPIPEPATPKQPQPFDGAEALSPLVLEDLANVRDRLEPEMLEFVTGAFARMMRVPKHLQLQKLS